MSSLAFASDPLDAPTRPHPRRVVQRGAAPADAHRSAAASRHAGAGRSARTWPRCSRGAHRALGERRPVDRRTRRGARHPAPVAADPLVRAVRLEKALGTPARIYFKDESVSPAGSHKPNTAVPQAFYNHLDGLRRLTTETGAGQWGTALASACAQFDLDLKVYMVRASYEQKPYRRIAIETWGGRSCPHRSTSRGIRARWVRRSPMRSATASATTTHTAYRDEGWCAALQGGGASARGSPRSGRACPRSDGSVVRSSAARTRCRPAGRAGRRPATGGVLGQQDVAYP